jgi:5'-nucleotidase
MSHQEHGYAAVETDPSLTVLVDMDGVLAGFDTEIIRLLAEHHPHIPIAGRKNFYISHDYPEHAELVQSLSAESGFFRDLPVIDGALEGWQRLIDLGYQPRICSSPLRRNPTSAEDKLVWLGHHFAPVFGDQIVEQAIITRSKHLYDGIALIDDRPQLPHADLARWQHLIFDQPYNQDVHGVRLHGWGDPSLGEHLAHAAELYSRLGNSAMRAQPAAE